MEINYSRVDHAAFLDAELTQQVADFRKKLYSRAIALLESGEMFVAQFLKFNEAGQMLLMLNTSVRGVPRKGEYLRAMIIKDDYQNYKTWGEITYGEIIKNGQINYSEAVCIWHYPSENPNYTIVGFTNIDISFAQALVSGCIIILGPHEPPIDYLMNLQDYVKLSQTTFSKDILDRSLFLQPTCWQPELIENDSSYIRRQLSISDVIVIQGPPGTGKTTLLAELIDLLVKENKSVLATSLTNRALIELASKPALIPHLEKGKVFKASLKWDERVELPDLNPIDECFASSGVLTLATFFQSSGWGKNCQDPIFDVVIMDEASQAFLSMLALSGNIGKKVIWVGDPKQLPPIVTLAEGEIIKRKAIPLIKGMETIINNFSFPSFRLKKTFRLSPRAAAYTGIFYGNSLESAHSGRHKYFFPEMPSPYKDVLSMDGGPILRALNLPAGEPAPEVLIKEAVQWAKAFLKVEEDNFEIAILAKQKKTVRAVQLMLNREVGIRKNLLVETVERVQGLTCDVCIYLLPDRALSFSLDLHLFNVATSRAKRHTILLASDVVLHNPPASGEVQEYLSKLTPVQLQHQLGSG
jgi:DNA replication ATP-dependent helicase Dna2